MSSFATALKDLASSQKTPKGVPAYTLYVNRRAGRVMAAAAHVLSVSPNQVTAVSVLLTFSGLAIVASIPPAPGMAFIVTGLLVLGFVLDSADGQLARLQNAGSRSGEWLDHVTDCAKILAVHMAVLVAFYRFFDVPSYAYLLPIGFQFAAVLLFFAGILAEKLKDGETQHSTTATPALPRLRPFAMLPVDYGVLCGAFLFLGNQQLFLIIYGTLFAAYLLFLAAYLVKWFRELSVPSLMRSFS